MIRLLHSVYLFVCVCIALNFSSMSDQRVAIVIQIEKRNRKYKTFPPAQCSISFNYFIMHTALWCVHIICVINWFKWRFVHQTETEKKGFQNLFHVIGEDVRKIMYKCWRIFWSVLADLSLNQQIKSMTEHSINSN